MHTTLKDIKDGFSLGKAWFIFFEFTPWRGKIEKTVMEVALTKVETSGDKECEVYCTFEVPKNMRNGETPFYNHAYYSAYYGSLRANCEGWCGMFDTKEEALQAYAETMSKWIDNI